MAKNTTDKNASTEVATKTAGAGAIATMDASMFAADSGAGMENTDSESFAIPFLSVLQKGSPTVDEALPTYVEGHRAGMFYENVTGGTFDGKKGVVIVPCAYRRVFVRWGAKDAGGGFKGEVAVDEIAAMRASGKIVEVDGKLLAPMPDGSVNIKTSDLFKDTRNHYILLIDEATGAWKEALLSLTSTQIKKSKALMSALASVKLNGPAGMFSPPTYANQVRATSLGESNDKGSWFGVKFELAGQVNRPEVYAAAKAFHASVSKGGVVAKYEDDDTVGSGHAGGEDKF